MFADLCLEGQERGVPGLDPAEPLEEFARADQIAALTPGHQPARSEQIARRRRYARAIGQLVRQADHTFPVRAPHANGVFQERERRLATRIEAQRLLQELTADFQVLMAERPACAEAKRRVRLGLGSFDSLERFTLCLENRLRALRVDQQTFVQRRRSGIGRIDRVRLRQNSLVFARREATSDARCAQEDLCTIDRRGCRMRVTQQGGDALLPFIRPDLRVEQALADISRLSFGVLQCLRVSFCGALVLAHVTKDVAEFAEQRALHARVRSALQLQLQQLLHHVELAQLPINRTRFTQRVEQRRIELVRVLKVLQRSHALQELDVQHAAEPQMNVRLQRRVLGRSQALLQCFDDAVPVVVALKLFQTLL